MSQKGGFLNFLRPLVTAGLPLMKSVLTPLANSVLLPFGLSAAMSATYGAIQKEFMDQHCSIINFKLRNRRQNENS